jgi:hypothetical protein
MKVLIFILICFLAGTSFGWLDCRQSRSNIKGGEGGNLPIREHTCENKDEIYCVFMSGFDKTGSSSSVAFAYRGCYTELLNMTDYYHIPSCPGGHFKSPDGAVTGDLTCCSTPLCNPASIVSNSVFLLLLPILAFCSVYW